jgi:uracil-DNA glycosylase family 4
MEGFFSKKEIDTITRPDGKPLTCITCGLYKDCKSPRMQPFGNFKRGIMVIGEAPVKIDDDEGKPFQGKTGKLLQRTLRKLGVDLFEDCVSINACNCRPMDSKGNNRPPENIEVDCCRKRVLTTIEKYKPKVIVLLGNMAVYSLIGHRWKGKLDGITKWRGWAIPDQDLQAWLCPTFHPSFIERQDDRNRVAEVIWEKDLFNSLREGMIFPKYKEPEIEIIKDLSILRKHPFKVVVPDFETTGIKPHMVGHKIVCCSLADTPDHTFVFMMPEKRVDRLPLVELFTNPKVEKRGHNIKFEQLWALNVLRCEIVNWTWDSMLAAHVFDNRPGITNLAFQTYVNFGIIDYKSEVGAWLKSTDDKNANAFNRILEFIQRPEGPKKLLNYCGYDAINEFRLSELQMKEVENLDLPF